MKIINKITITFLILLGLFGVGFFDVKVDAELLSYNVSVSTEDGETISIIDSSSVPGINYDKKAATLTLNGYNGGNIMISYMEWDDEDRQMSLDLTIKVIGDNTINDYRARGMIGIDGNINVSVIGDGKLNLNGGSSYYSGFDASTGNRYGKLVFDGPTINFRDELASGFIDIILKNGTINGKSDITLDPYEDRFFVESSSFLFADSIDIKGGKINLEYILASDYDESMELIKNGGEIIYAMNSKETPICLSGELKKNVNIIIPKGFEKYVEPYKKNEICVYVLENDNNIQSASIILNETDNVSSIKGLSWDDNNKTLIINGYDGNQLGIASSFYQNDIKIKVVGNNKIRFKEAIAFDDLDYFEITLDGLIWNTALVFDDVGCEFIGDGTLNVYAEAAYARGIVVEGGDCIINGPAININVQQEKAIYTYKFIMKAGNVKIYRDLEKIKPLYENSAYVDFRSAIEIFGPEFKILGGTIALIYENQLDKKFYYTTESPISIDKEANMKNVDALIEECLLVFAGPEDLLEKQRTIDCSGNVKYGKNATILHGESIDKIEKVDISKINASIVQGEFLYSGKAIEPEVNMGGLVKNVDYTVTYENNIKVGTAVAIVTGKGFYKGTIKLNFVIKENKSIKEYGPKKGKNIKDKTFRYKVLKQACKDGTVVGKLRVIGLVKKNIKKVTIKNKVTIKGCDYIITEIGNNAFKKNKKITKVIIGKNIKSIGKNAFKGCKKLKTLQIKSTKLKKVGKNAIKGTSKKLVVKTPKSKKASYEKKFKKAGNKKVKVK